MQFMARCLMCLCVKARCGTVRAIVNSDAVNDGMEQRDGFIVLCI